MYLLFILYFIIFLTNLLLESKIKNYNFRILEKKKDFSFLKYKTQKKMLVLYI